MNGRWLLTKLDMALVLSMIVPLKTVPVLDQAVDAVHTAHLNATQEENTL